MSADLPPFGRSMLAEWLLDPSLTYLNHGTVGATPRTVLARQQAIRDEIERQPARFMLRELNGLQPMPWREISRLREAAAPVAAFLGAKPADVVFVQNVTAGLNAVLRSVPLAPGHEVLIPEFAYGATARAAAATCAARGATLHTAPIAFPPPSPGAVVDAVVSALTPRTTLVVVDHVTSNTALVMPVADVAEACQARGVRVLVDGAHAPGAIEVDIPAIGADWYAANLHKWAHAPRPCGILWAAPDCQAALHAPVTSWGHDLGFHAEFEHGSTIDPSAYLAAPDGMALLNAWGFERVRRYTHGLAADAATMLTDRWRTRFHVPASMTGSMVTVPLPERAGATDTEAAALKLALLVEDQIEVHLFAWKDRLWTRVSAQVYNEEADVLRLADAIARRTGLD